MNNLNTCIDCGKEKNNRHIVSFSGGKDSTAMLLLMLEKKMAIDDIIFCDTGMEFPQMYEHIKKVEIFISRPITILKHKKTFEYFLGSHIKKNGCVGYGFPDFRNRWCTALLKRDLFKKYVKNKNNNIEYHGIAFDELHRTFKNNDNRNIKYPLVDWKITEKEALEYCYSKGFDWGGLYEKFHRVSCWCCPLKRIGELRILYKDFPELWNELKRLDRLSYRKFRNDYSVKELEEKFKVEEKE